MAIWKYYYSQSGLALKCGIYVGEGVFGSDFSGKLCVICLTRPRNHMKLKYVIVLCNWF